MKTNFIKKLLIMGLVGLTVLSCTKNAEDPDNQAEEKGHGEASTIIFTFKEGVLNDASTAVFAKDFTPSEEKKVTYTVSYDEKGEFIPNDNVVELNPDVWYELSIDLRNRAGESINDEHLTPEQQLMHQFFFRTYLEHNERVQGKVEYRYGDIVNGKLTETPVGFKGYIKFSKELSNFELRTTLVHVTPPASKLDKNGKPYSFENPATYLLGVVDIDTRTPIKIKKKAMEKPAMIKVIFTEGHTHGPLFHANPFSDKSKSPYKKQQTISLKLQEDGTYKIEKDGIFRLKQGAYWAVETIVYDKDGNRINAIYNTEEAVNKYQLFMNVSDVIGIKDNKKKEGELKDIMADFVYRDTKPENQMISITDAKLLDIPVGFKGYFNTVKTKYVQFKLNISFVDLDANKKVDGKYRAADAKDVKGDVLFKYSLPVRIFCAHPMTDDETDIYLKDVANEFNISFEDAENYHYADFDLPVEGPGANKYYM